MPTNAETLREPSTRAGADPLRILFLCGEYPLVGGGFGSYVRSLAPALAARGHEVHVLSCLGGQPRRDYRDGPVWVHERGKARLRLGVRRLLGGSETWERFVSGISCWVEEAKLRVPFDVIEIADFGAEGLLLGLGRRKPLVAHLHGPLRLTQRYSGVEPQRDTRLADWLERTTVARADLITSPSDLVSRDLWEARWLRGGPARTIRNPVDVERWAEVAPVRNSRPLILAVGRVEHLKGPEVLVEAAVRLVKEAGDVEVVFVGRSSGERRGLQYRDWIAKLASHLRAPCRFVEQVPRSKLRSWYEAARVVAVPSLYESLSMSGLEAMASGRPLVCSSSTGVAELVAGSGAGTVVPPGSPDLLAGALLPYVLDPDAARTAGGLGRQLMRDTCSPEQIAEQRERCYREVVPG
jgi:glycosyltransferase involved in cell wall biosynthesis